MAQPGATGRERVSGVIATARRAVLVGRSRRARVDVFDAGVGSMFLHDEEVFVDHCEQGDTSAW